MENIDLTSSKVFSKKKMEVGSSTMSGLRTKKMFGMNFLVVNDIGRFVTQSKKVSFKSLFLHRFTLNKNFYSCDCCGTEFKYSSRIWWCNENCLCKKCEEMLNMGKSNFKILTKWDRKAILKMQLTKSHNDIMRKIRLSY